MSHRQHLLLCLLLVITAGLGYLFIPQLHNLGWSSLILLACPLMHLLMPHHHHDPQAKTKPKTNN